MNKNHLTHLTGDPTLPDLLPEEPIYDDLFSINDLIMPVPHPDIAELNRRIELLTVEINTQGLRLEIEKTKRQRLQSSVRQMKRELAVPCPNLVELRNELIQFKDQQTAINYQLDGENVKTNTLAFRSISRICQLLAVIIPGAIVSPESSPEMKILLQELSLTVQQFGVHYAASYVEPQYNDKLYVGTNIS